MELGCCENGCYLHPKGLKLPPENNSCSVFLQASQMIVSYDEHEVNNTFKFGVIYQKFRQVSNPRAVLGARIPAGRRSAFHEHGTPVAETWPHGPCCRTRRVVLLGVLANNALLLARVFP